MQFAIQCTNTFNQRISYLETTCMTDVTNMALVVELPNNLTKQLIKIAENCVIKSNLLSRDETPDFIQNCLVKLLMQIEEERVVKPNDSDQHYLLKKDGSTIELERWFGTTATNMSIDRYRFIKRHESVSLDHASNDDFDTQPIQIPEPSSDMDESLKKEYIESMASYCSDAMDECMDTTWAVIAAQKHGQLQLIIQPSSPFNDKGSAIASYCQLLLQEKYLNDGPKIHSHDSVCEQLGIEIKPENISYKKKKYEELMMGCIQQKLASKYGDNNQDRWIAHWIKENN